MKKAKVKAKVKAKTAEGVDSTLKKRLSFDESNMETHIMQQAAWYEFYGEMWAEAVRNVSSLQIKLEALYAELDAEIRAKADRAGEKITEAKIAASIKSDKRYIRAKEELVEAEFEANRCYIIRQAFQQKKDMLDVLMRKAIKDMFADVSTTGLVDKTSANLIRNKMKKSKKKGGE